MGIGGLLIKLEKEKVPSNNFKRMGLVTHHANTVFIPAHFISLFPKSPGFSFAMLKLSAVAEWNITEKAVCDYKYNGKLKPRNFGNIYELVLN